MARWRLTASHYLKVPGTFYRYEETDRETGEVNQQQFEVPMYLDIRNPPKRYNQNGNIIVTQGSGGMPQDVRFEGPPTADMEPLDDEAREISAKHQHLWTDPMGGAAFPSQGDFGQGLITKLEKMMDELTARAAGGQPVSAKGIDPEAFAALQKQVLELVEQNAKLANQLAEPKVAVGGRR